MQGLIKTKIIQKKDQACKWVITKNQSGIKREKKKSKIWQRRKIFINITLL